MILLPTILLSLLLSTLFRSFQCPGILISSWAHLALTQLAGITFAGLITCSTFIYPAALMISITTIFGLCPSFDLQVFDWQQLYEMLLYMGSFIICWCVHNPIQSFSNSSCSQINFNIDVRMDGSFGPLFLSMKSISSYQCVTSVYEAWRCWGDISLRLPFNLPQITNMNGLSGNSGRLLLMFFPTGSPKSVTGSLMPLLSFSVTSWISLAHFWQHFPTYCHQTNWALSKLSNGRQFSNVAKKSGTLVLMCSSPSRSSFKQFCPQIIDEYSVSIIPATNTFFHLLNAL